MTGSVRIIGGQWRRRLLRFPEQSRLRPTPDRVRETLFNWLGQDLTGCACLDLFAGSGALGFEAASRGASKVVMVERDPVIAGVLRSNAQTLDAEAVEVVRADALQFAASAACSFDVVFLDPPYRLGLLEQIAPLLARLIDAGNGDAAIYAEAEYPIARLGDFEVERQGRAGQVYYHLLRRQDRP